MKAQRKTFSPIVVAQARWKRAPALRTRNSADGGVSRTRGKRISKMMIPRAAQAVGPGCRAARAARCGLPKQRVPRMPARAVPSRHTGDAAL